MSLEDQARSLFLSEIDDIVEETGETKDLAFVRWVCQNILEISDDAKVDEAISIGGPNEYCVDIFHYEDSDERSENYVCWAQAKFSEDLDRTITRQEISDFGKTIEYLESCPDLANPVFKQKSAEFNALGGVEAPIRKRMIYAVTGQLNQQAQELIANPAWNQQVLGNIHGPKIEFEVLNLNKILDYITKPTTQTIRMKFDGDVMKREDNITKKHSIIGYVKAKDLVDITKKNKDRLFSQNPRQHLGRATTTNKAIFATLNDQDRKQKFWKLNNGITAICDKIQVITYSPPEYEIQNFKVVNGRQTAYSLENNLSTLDDTVSVFMTVHETADPKEGTLISETTNTQNPIKPVDLITNFPEMNNMVLQCKKNYKEFYFERQTRGFQVETKATRHRVTRRRILEKNAIARSYYAYTINPHLAMTVPDKDFFSAVDPQYYNQVFQNRNIKDLIVPHIFMQMLKALYDKWRLELKQDPPIETHLRDKEILSKRIVQFFILRFISKTMESLTDTERPRVEKKIIETFRALKKEDPIPNDFLEIAQTSYDNFMMCFDLNRNETWPEKLMDKINDPAYNSTPEDVPIAYDIMYVLKLKGASLLPALLTSKDFMVEQTTVDGIKLKLLSLISNPSDP